MAEVITIGSKLENSYLISNEPKFDFTGHLSESLPDFFKEQIIGTEDYRTITLLEKEEETLNTFYLMVKNLFEQIDLSVASPKFIYQLGQLLGLTELVDLTYSTDFTLIEKQRGYVKSSLDRFLIKGTSVSIIQLFESLDLNVTLQELWTEDFQSYYTYTNRYFKDFIKLKKYNNNQTLGLSATHKEINYTTFDILNEIDVSMGTPQNIQEILKIEHNNYGYLYVLGKINGNLNKLYLRDTSNQWRVFDDIPLSGNVKDFRPINDRLILLEDVETTYPLLKIFTYNDLDLSIFTIDNVQFFKVVYSNGISYLLLDVVSSLSPLTTQVQLWDLEEFTIVGDVQLKPFNEPITELFENKKNEWVAFDRENNKLFYIDKIQSGLYLPLLSGNIEFFPNAVLVRCDGIFICNGIITANGGSATLSGGEFHINKTKDSDKFIIVNLDKTLSDSSVLFRNLLTIDRIALSGTNDTSAIITGLSGIQDIHYLDGESLFYLSKNGIGVYFVTENLIYKELNNFNDGLTYQRAIDTDTFINVYLSRIDGGNNYTLTFFDNMFYLFGGKRRFKTNKFNVLIDSPTDIDINEVIKTIKPLNTNIKEIINI